MAYPDALRSRGVPTGLSAVFGVVAERRTYRNLLYLLLAFPLGVLYFTVLVTVGSVGVELGPPGVLVVPVLLGATHALARIERAATVRLLDVEIPASGRPIAWFRAILEEQPSVGALWRRTKSVALARHTWTRLGYLLVKFPLGMATFVLLTFLGTFSVGTLAAPVLYDAPGAGTTYQFLRPVATVVVPVTERAGLDVGGVPTLAVSATPHEVETLLGAITTAVAGACLGVTSLHLLNALARASGWFAAVMLRSDRPG